MLDAEAMDITAVPTLFVNGRRHTAPHDVDSLILALLSSGPAISNDGREANEVRRT